MVQHLGGAEALLDAWKDCIYRDLEKGGLPAFRHLAVSLKFMEYCEPEPGDCSTTSDEEFLDQCRNMATPSRHSPISMASTTFEFHIDGICSQAHRMTSAYSNWGIASLFQLECDPIPHTS